MAAGYDLLVLDLAGTLVAEGGAAIEPALAAAIRSAAGAGLLVALATDGLPAGVDPHRDDLGLRAPTICYSGAVIRATDTGENLLRLDLPRGTLREAHALFAHAPVHPLFCRDDRLYCLERSLAVRRYADEQGVRPEVMDDPEGFLAQGAFAKGVFIGHPRDLAVLRADLQGEMAGRVRLAASRADQLEMIPAAASKGAAVSWLAGHLGVPLERVAAAGDQETDLEMLAAVGAGVAMATAPEPVRRAADRLARAEPGGLLAALCALMPDRFAVASRA